MDLGRLQKELSEGKVRPYYLIYGEDGLLIDRALKAICDTLMPTCGELNFNAYHAARSRPHRQ